MSLGKIVFVLLSVCYIVNLNAQRTISGKVSSSDSPLPAVSVLIDGTATGTETLEDGSFSLPISEKGGQRLLISKLGFRRHLHSIPAGTNNITLEITLQPDYLNLEQFVVTGTRDKTAASESTVPISTLNQETLTATQSLTLSEGLPFSAGLRVENNCQNCGFTQVRMNGLEGPYSQLLINSRPVFSALAGVYGLDMFPANMIDRIEVSRGGGSVMYGGNAIAGTINIITKDPEYNGFEAGMNYAFTDMQRPDRVVTLSGSVTNADNSAGLRIYGFNRDRDWWDATGDGFSDMTMIKNTTLGFDGFLNTGERSVLRLNAYRIEEFRRGGNRFDLFPHQTDLTEQLAHTINGVSSSWELRSKNSKHRMQLYGAFQSVLRDSYYGGGGRVLADGDSLTEEDLLAINAYGKAKDWSVNGGVLYHWNISTRYRLTMGSEIQGNRVEDQMPGYGRDITQQVWTTGTYAQLELEPLPRFSIVAGGRFDYVSIRSRYNVGAGLLSNDRDLPVFVPRLAMMYSIGNEWKLRASFAQGYRAPQAFDEDLHIGLVGGNVLFVALAEDLKTERSNSVTASVNYAKSKLKNQISLTAEGFYTWLNNPFILSDQQETAQGVSVITKRNGDGARVFGANTEFNWAIASKWQFQAGITVQQARFNEEEIIWEPDSENSSPDSITSTSRLLRTPDVYGFSTLTYTPVKPLSLSLGTVFTGPMDVPHVIDPETEFTIIRRTPSFIDFTLRAAYRLTLKNKVYIECSAGMFNLLNQFQRDLDTGPERDAGYVYGPLRPRTIFTGIKVGF
jgi:outer membrane receptor for ferrienterochelin and colicins